MPYNVSFISLGCAKNQVNCEQMMATVQHAGHNVVLSPKGAWSTPAAFWPLPARRPSIIS